MDGSAASSPELDNCFMLEASSRWVSPPRVKTALQRRSPAISGPSTDQRTAKIHQLASNKLGSIGRGSLPLDDETQRPIRRGGSSGGARHYRALPKRPSTGIWSDARVLRSDARGNSQEVSLRRSLASRDSRSIFQLACGRAGAGACLCRGRGTGLGGVFDTLS